MTTTTITICRNIEVSDTECFDLMTTAVEGGINYWADVSNVARDADMRVTSCIVAESEGGTLPGAMSTAMVLHGIHTLGNLIYAFEVHSRSEIAEGFAECLIDPDGFSAADAILADAIVQAAMFGAIIYG